eukprot:10326854-Alexandrium_andersonii.AAC.1
MLSSRTRSRAGRSMRRTRPSPTRAPAACRPTSQSAGWWLGEGRLIAGPRGLYRVSYHVSRVCAGLSGRTAHEQ